MHRQPVLYASLVALLLTGFFACRRPEQPPSEFRVRLVTSLPVSGRWERAAERGLGRIAAELGADVSRLRAADEAERRTALVEQATGGADLLFCVGPGFERLVYSEAGSFPDSRFVILPGRAAAANVAGVEFLPDGAGYVAGVVAAHLTDSSTVGVLRGSGGAWLEDLEQGFLIGFRSARPDGEPVIATPPDGPRSLVDRGAEVALYAADRVEPEVLVEARSAGLLLVATDAELMERLPEVVAAGVYVDVAEAMVRIARDVRDGLFHGGTYAFDFGSGVLDVTINPGLPIADDPSLQEALEVARSEVTAGIVEIEQLGM